ncbi:hypothetical protein [Nesterenkonia populi]|uniref:hypothetical protein n=1 Tax=Nesterenkonia populi TaxID=1591087 RepID=UPI0011BF4394|nr:hypothetical protein [Nesterenkonia populi]
MPELHDVLAEIKNRAYLATPAPGERFVPKEMMRRSQADVPTLIALVEPIAEILRHSGDANFDPVSIAEGCVCDICNLIIGTLNARQESAHA